MKLCSSKHIQEMDILSHYYIIVKLCRRIWSDAVACDISGHSGGHSTHVLVMLEIVVHKFHYT